MPHLVKLERIDMMESLPSISLSLISLVMDLCICIEKHSADDNRITEKIYIYFLLNPHFAIKLSYSFQSVTVLPYKLSFCDFVIPKRVRLNNYEMHTDLFLWYSNFVYVI